MPRAFLGSLKLWCRIVLFSLLVISLPFSPRGNRETIIYIFSHDTHTQQTLPFCPLLNHTNCTHQSLDRSPEAGAALACPCGSVVRMQKEACALILTPLCSRCSAPTAALCLCSNLLLSATSRVKADVNVSLWDWDAKRLRCICLWTVAYVVDYHPQR